MREGVGLRHEGKAPHRSLRITWTETLSIWATCRAWLACVPVPKGYKALMAATVTSRPSSAPSKISSGFMADTVLLFRQEPSPLP